MKRMIIGAIIALGDLWGYANTFSDLQYFKNTGEYPTPNISRNFFIEILIWSVILGISVAVFIIGFLANKNSYKQNNDGNTRR